MRMWTSTLAIVLLAACTRREGITNEAPESTVPAPVESPPPSASTTTVTATWPAAPISSNLPKPTAAEAKETDIGAYTPFVPNPTPFSKLPCPPGTAQSNGENVIECRAAGVAGKSLSHREGPSIWFHKNGKVARSGAYEHHEWTGRWWEFAEDGHLERSTSYKAGASDGVEAMFYPNGKRSSETVYTAGKRNGPSKLWTEDGELMSIVIFDNGVIKSTKTFAYTLKPPTAEDMKRANEELEKALEEQRALMERLRKEQ